MRLRLSRDVAWTKRASVLVQGNGHFNAKRWTGFKRGDHFATMERPKDFTEGVRAFAREIDGV